jgi:hypothetical protein
VDELVDGASGAKVPGTALRDRLVALRVGIAEVTELPEIRQLSDPGIDSSNRAAGRQEPLPGDPE